MALDEQSMQEFDLLSREARRRNLISLSLAGSGHPGGSLSAVEILIGLYYHKLRHDPNNPNWAARDFFILSKGHGCMALYTVLAMRGFFELDALKDFRKIGALLQGHAHRGVPGVELSTGSLGQGLSVTNGLALAAKLDGRDSRCYCLMGDGEVQEGSIWEAAMTAGFRKLDNVCAILDNNGLQQNGPIEKIKGYEPILEKWRAFGWHTVEVDGHDIQQVISALDEAEQTAGKPTFICAHTVKGKGVSFMEGNHKWHGKAPNKEELRKALEELAVSGTGRTG